MRVWHEKFLAVQRVTRTLPGRFKLDTAGIKASGRFSQRKSSDEFTFSDLREELFFKGVGATLDKSRCSHQGGGEEGSRNQCFTHFFDYHGHIEESAVGAAVLLGNQQPRPSLADQFLPELSVVSSLMRHHLADEFGGTVVGQKALGRITQHFLFFRKSEIQ